jgi:RHS repeat-associated protein
MRNVRRVASLSLQMGWMALFLVFPTASAFCQSNVNEEQGLKPFDSTSGGDLDSVSLTNGGLTLQIPIVSFPQRGSLDLSFFLTYSTKQWYVKRTTNCGVNPNCTPTIVHYNWALARGNTGAHVVSSVDWFLKTTATLDPSYNQSVIAPDGATHLMGGNDLSATPVYPAYSLDATGMVLVGPVGGTPTLVIKNGTQFNYVNGRGINLQAGLQPASVTDANGNQITISSAGWTDTLGRLIPGSGSSTVAVTPGVATSDLSSCPSGTVSATLFSVPGPNNTSRNFKFCYANVTLQTSFGQSGVTEYGPTTGPLLTAVVRPDYTMWTLQYDSYGDVTRLVFPTGGSISYVYANRGVGCATDFTQTSRWVTSRTVDAADGTGGHTSTYTYAPNFLTTTVTDPNGNDVVHTETDMGQCQFYETQTQSYQGSASSGSLLKTTNTQYSGGLSSFDVNGSPFGVNIVAAQSSVTLPGGQTRKVVNSFDSGSFKESDGSPVVVGSLLRRDEYDFSGSLARSTLNHYLWQDSAAYKSANFLALVTSTTVTDGAGNQVAQATSAYDQVAVSSSGVATSLVSPPAGGNIRGNLTTASNWLNTTNSAISRLAVYFDTGMPASGTDPLGNTTNFAYSCAGAYQSQTALPDTNGVHHVVSGSYDCNSGLLTSFADQNGQLFTYQYDNMLRLTQASHADGGQTNFFFPDATTVERQRKIDSSRNDDSFAYSDGLGRTIKSQTNTPSGAVYSVTTYDPLGRVATVSNPYFSTSDPTYGVTQTQYDALGRILQVTKPDGSVAGAQYTNNCATATDEASHQRKSCSDAFGRLIEVDEPGNSFAGSVSGGTLTLNGTLRSQGGATATPGKGSVTVSGNEQTKQGTPFTSGSTNITITGGEMTTTVDPCYNPDLPPPGPSCPRDISDTGSVSITVNGFTASESYGASSTTASVASDLTNALNASSSPVTASLNGSTITIISKATGAGSNYSFSATSVTNDVNDFGGPSFVPSPTGGTLSGGGGSATVYDSGTCTVTVNGTAYGTAFGQGDTTSTIASGLAGAISGGTLASATSSGGTISMTAKQTGAATNYSLASSCSFNSSVFSSASFSAGASGSTFTGGADVGPTVYDSGTVTVSIGGFTASAPYSQSGNSTAVQVATALAGTGSSGLNRAGSPVSASASGAGISISYKTIGAAGNVAVSASPASNNSSAFPGGSFSGSTNLTGGADPVPSSLSNPYVTLYQYDTLGNLVSVNQQGDGSQAARARSFAYDSLSHLLTAHNPESGTVTYTYDADGNMATKQDARGLTITYSYDQLNRPTGKSYSDGTRPTTNYYDTAVYFPETNAIGRLVMATNNDPNHGGAANFSYDAMGRIIQQRDYTQSGWQPAITAQYNFLGALTSLAYPSGRQVTLSYNTGDQLDQVQFASFAGTTVGYNYWSAADNSFYPTGAPKSVTLGNGVVETYSFNQRLQLAENTVGSGGTTFADHLYNYAQGANNGNVMSVSDKLNSARTQIYTYDSLNRLITANESLWGVTNTYDPWGNLLQQNFTGSIPGILPTQVDSNNHITGAPSGCTSANAWCYDPAGNLLNDSFHQYSYNIEGQTVSVDNGNAAYTYDPLGQRVRKDITGQPSIEYIYFGGQPIAEHNLGNGRWDDYIFAGGRRIARASHLTNILQTNGTCNTRANGCRSQFTFSYSFLPNYQIQPGDKLYISQYATAGAIAGPALDYKDKNGNLVYGDTITGVYDQDGCPMNQDCLSYSGSAWHWRRIDLSPLAGATLTGRVYVETYGTTADNTGWSVYYDSIVLVTANGSVYPIFTGVPDGQAPSLANTWNQPGASGLSYNPYQVSWPQMYNWETTYYHADQLGSSRLLTTTGGWPVWQGTYTPFGREVNSEFTTNHYKFTGKERDAESNLDNFGARYNGSTLGRFMSSDWSALPVPVPYADNRDPQSLNLYSYVRNNPTSITDEDGHCFTCIPGESGGAPDGPAGGPPGLVIRPAGPLPGQGPNDVEVDGVWRRKVVFNLPPTYDENYNLVYRQINIWFVFPIETILLPPQKIDKLTLRSYSPDIPWIPNLQMYDPHAIQWGHSIPWYQVVYCVAGGEADNMGGPMHAPEGNAGGLGEKPDTDTVKSVGNGHITNYEKQAAINRLNGTVAPAVQGYQTGESVGNGVGYFGNYATCVQR